MSEIIRVKVRRGKHRHSKKHSHAKSLAPLSKKIEARYPHIYRAFCDLSAFFKRHRFFKILLITASFGALLLLISALFPQLAKGYSDTIGHFLRICLATATSFLPFSLAEALILAFLLFLPVWLVTLVLALIRKYKLRRIHRKMRHILLTPIAALCIVLCLFLFTLAPSYHRPPIAETVGVDDANVDTESLYETLRYFVAEINTDLIKIEDNQSKTGSTVMKLSFSEMADDLNLCYQNVASYNICPAGGIPAKKLFSSNLLAKSGLAGVYTFFTGETNINTAYPDFCTPYTTAHELAHARGIANESDADFAAFVACDASNEVYIRYSGYVNALTSMLNEIYAFIDAEAKANPEFAAEINTEVSSIIAELHPRFWEELEAYNDFYNETSDEMLTQTFEDLNDTYLKSQGQSSGVDSYQHLTALIVNFYVHYLA